MVRFLKSIAIVGAMAALSFSAAFAFADDNMMGDFRPSLTASTTAGDMHDNMMQDTKPSLMASTTAARIEEARTEIKNRVEEMRVTVQRRVAEMKDKMKQRLAQRIVNQFDHINKVWTDHFTKLLDRYDAILQKIQDRATAAVANGHDISAANTAIQSAKTAIDNARAAVQAQAEKTYTPDVSAPSTTATSTDDGQVMKEFRSSFQTLHTQLKQDLTALRDGAMKDARTAVQSALKTLGQVPGVDNEHATSTKSEATSTNE